MFVSWTIWAQKLSLTQSFSSIGRMETVHCSDYFPNCVGRRLPGLQDFSLQCFVISCTHCGLAEHVIVSYQSSFPLVFMSRQIPTMQSLCPYILFFSPNSLYVHYLFHKLGFESPASEFCGNHNNHQSSSSYCHRHTFMFQSCSNLCQPFSCP